MMDARCLGDLDRGDKHYVLAGIYGTRPGW
jgi:hypothetical protein